MASQRWPHPNLFICYLTEQKDFSGMSQLKILEWGYYSTFSEQAQCNHKSLMGGRTVREKKNVRAESEIGKESRCHAPRFADDERGQTEECGQPLEAGK